ncbi:MAG: radical SAM protein [Thermoguttaceae bacterium]|jgi:DNA repair photolyase|nr:radical SAM protein [Thermoguttaceae bacterium]
MLVREIEAADYVSPSKLSDYVINPYVGCPHACRYCYASFMRRLTNRHELWGEFLDVKRCSKPLGVRRLTGKSVFMSTVTDCYNPFEAKYKVTRQILEELALIECELTITTKSNLLLRDLDLLTARTQLFRNRAALFDAPEELRRGIHVMSSINTLDEDFRKDMDQASTIEERLNMLETCYEAGIPTSLFMSPIFPYITDFRALVDRAVPFVNTIWFENLNLRQGYKEDILAYVRARYPEHYRGYLDIYQRGDVSYWLALKEEIEDYCARVGISCQMCFHY